MNTLITYSSLLLQGAAITVAAWFIASILSLIIGSLMGIISCRYFALSHFVPFVRLYMFIAKGAPALVQILIAYFVIPALFGVNILGFIAATVALAFFSSGNITEVIRSELNTIPREQWDACLSYPIIVTIWRTIIPQTIRNILPTLLAELEQLLKNTSILAMIWVAELSRMGREHYLHELNPIPFYLIITTIYLVLSGLMQLIILKGMKKNRE